jgi:hypothetical protein
MKKLFLLASLLLTSTSFANELHHYNDVKAAVITGKTIHIAVDLSSCIASSKEMAQSTSIGVFTPNAIQVNNNHIATSLTHFTLNNPNFPGKPVYEFVRYTITEDNNVNLTDQVLDAVNYAPLSPKISFNCKIDTSAKIYV